MDMPAVLGTLNDLPRTFRKTAAPYTQVIDSIAASLAAYTNGTDATGTQISAFGLAVDGWLDVWGLLFGVPRNQQEANSVYATRIARTVLAWVGTLPAIQMWIDWYAPGGSVSENASGLGYVINLPPYMTTAQIADFLASLDRIRPAGVPFSLTQTNTGLYLGTEVFLGDARVMGSYLATSPTNGAPDVAATTLSSRPILPALYLEDPYLAEPGLVGAGPQGVWPIAPRTPSAKAAYPFWVDGGTLILVDPAQLTQSPFGLAAWSFWSNSGELAIVPGTGPTGGGRALFYGTATLIDLMTVGGAGLPSSNPGPGTGQFWNDGYVVAVA